MKTLALDLATEFGWAWFEDGVLEYSSHHKLKGKTRGHKMGQFYEWLEAELACHDADMVVWEAVAPGHFQAMKFLCKMEGIVEMVTAGVPNKQVHSGTLKKWACGYGKATKEQMMDIARQYEPLVGDNNQADAILVGVYFHEQDNQENRYAAD